MSTGTNEVAEKMSKGVAHSTLAQLDKHSDEPALQRISEPVTEVCIAVDKAIRTDIPELQDNGLEIIMTKSYLQCSLQFLNMGLCFTQTKVRTLFRFIVKHRYLVKSTLCLVGK